MIEELRFLSESQVRNIATEFGTPVFVYDEKKLRETAADALAFPNAYGLTARYAMKANPNAAILKVFTEAGMHIDASSEYEVQRAMLAGVPAENILLTSQALAHSLKDLVAQGVFYNATSFEQLELYGQCNPGGEVGIRFNPGLGSGGTKRTNVGGPASSFGIWHEHIGRVQELVEKHQLKVVRVHTHIGSGTDPKVWAKVSGMSIQLLNHFPDATVLNLGGGHKVGRMSEEVSTDLNEVGAHVSKVFKEFAKETGREIHLEIEPGTFMVANAGCLISSIDAITSTGSEGYQFYKLDSGMTEILRPSMYGAQHPLVVVNREAGVSTETEEVVVVGHCCESGDILTPEDGDPEGLKPRTLQAATRGDFLVVEGAGAYCAGMSAKNYNSFPECAEAMLRLDGSLSLIRKRQTLEQVVQNEVHL